MLAAKRHVSDVRGRLGRNKIADAQEEDYGKVLNEEERTTIVKWVQGFQPFQVMSLHMSPGCAPDKSKLNNNICMQDTFRKEAPPDFTVWEVDAEGKWVSVTESDPAHFAVEEPSPVKATPQEPTAVKSKSKLWSCFGVMRKPKVNPIVDVSANQPPPEPVASRVPLDVATKNRAVCLRCMDLHRVPVEGDLGSHVQFLDLSDNLITRIDNNECDRLTALTSLNLANNKIESIPDRLGILDNLRTLKLNRNRLAELPHGLVWLKSLTDLDINDNRITELSPSFSQLVSLQNFDASNNLLETIPETLASCPLFRLNLSSNRISSLPEELEALGERCQELNLHNNKLQSLTWNLGSFGTLSVLSMHKNGISSLPEDLCSLSMLTALEFHHNKVRQLPPDLGTLYSLTRIVANNNGLTKLPDSLCDLEQMTSIQVHSNRLTHIPNGVCKLTNLTRLTAQNNRIVELPEDGVQDLTKLKTLLLQNNQISVIREGFGLQHLTNLEELDFDNNPLGDVHLLAPSVKSAFVKVNRVLPVSSHDRDLSSSRRDPNSKNLSRLNSARLRAAVTTNFAPLHSPFSTRTISVLRANTTAELARNNSVGSLSRLIENDSNMYNWREVNDSANSSRRDLVSQENSFVSTARFTDDKISLPTTPQTPQNNAGAPSPGFVKPLPMIRVVSTSRMVAQNSVPGARKEM